MTIKGVHEYLRRINVQKKKNTRGVASVYESYTKSYRSSAFLTPNVLSVVDQSNCSRICVSVLPCLVFPGKLGNLVLDRDDLYISVDNVVSGIPVGCEHL